MFDATAKGPKIWRGCRYGFFGKQLNERATIVFEISDDNLTLITSHNLDCERYLVISGIHIKLNAHVKPKRCTNQVKRIKRDIK